MIRKSIRAKKDAAESTQCDARTIQKRNHQKKGNPTNTCVLIVYNPAQDSIDATGFVTKKEKGITLWSAGAHLSAIHHPPPKSAIRIKVVKIPAPALSPLVMVSKARGLSSELLPASGFPADVPPVLFVTGPTFEC